MCQRKWGEMEEENGDFDILAGAFEILELVFRKERDLESLFSCIFSTFLLAIVYLP
jgi:hypothetical protein